jgi:hypothetical protein
MTYGINDPLLRHYALGHAASFLDWPEHCGRRNDVLLTNLSTYFLEYMTKQVTNVNELYTVGINVPNAPAPTEQQTEAPTGPTLVASNQDQLPGLENNN